MLKTIIKTPKQAIRAVKPLIQDWYKEHFFGIYLNSRNELIKKELITLGTLITAVIHPREIFRPAIVSRACGIIVLHNHPSGDITPSQSDRNITKQLVKAGKIIGIEVLDHVIFCKNRTFYSFKNIDNL